MPAAHADVDIFHAEADLWNSNSSSPAASPSSPLKHIFPITNASTYKENFELKLPLNYSHFDRHITSNMSSSPCWISDLGSHDFGFSLSILHIFTYI